MKKIDLTRSTRLLDEPLRFTPRILCVIATVLLVLVYFLPLWSLTMFAPQYPDGLRLYIYGYKLESGNDGRDAKEVDVLNHYIGMKSLAAEDFTEFKWIPFAVGAFALLFLRVAVLGRVHQLLDIVVLYLYFGLFSLASFAYKLYSYGHQLDPTAPIRVDGFMPPLFGYKKIANFDIYSYPGGASYALAAVGALLIAALVIGIRKARRAAKDSAARVKLVEAA